MATQKINRVQILPQYTYTYKQGEIVLMSLVARDEKIGRVQFTSKLTGQQIIKSVKLTNIRFATGEPDLYPLAIELINPVFPDENYF